MVRFLHTADWQIGMKAAHVGPVGERVRSERLEAARRVVRVAGEEGADFIIVAGDTFEDNGVDRVLVQRVADILGEFRGSVYLIPGNHDPFVPGSVWHHPAWSAHANLHVLVKPDPVEAEGVMLFPCPLREKYARRDPTRWIDATQCGRIAVGVAHGSIEEIAPDDLDFPIARNAASRSGLDYLAVGHWHSTAVIRSEDGAERLAYSGTHETTRFGERDSGNVLLVEIAERGAPPKLTRIRTGGLVWNVLQPTIRSADELRSLRETIEAMPSPDRTLLKVQPTGLLVAEACSELDRIEELVRARFLYGRVDFSQLLPAPDDDCWVTELPAGVVRRVAERLRQLAGSADAPNRPEWARPEVASRALFELYRMRSEGSP
ncbi:MAG TPA: DNA repair exonuclease [Planctomycetaceae bacterium]|nr:DNA repair exonuclease [Planctomycetaceae bacterium]